MNVLKTSPLFTQTNAMNAICKPLFANTPIGVFGYVRHYPNNTIMILTTQPEFIKAALKKQYVADTKRIIDIMQFNKVNFFHDTFYYLLQESNPKASALGKEYNIDSTLGIIDQLDDYLESFVFASKKNQNLLRFYFNNLGLLVQFKHYFLDKAKPIIDIAEKSLFTPVYHSTSDGSIGNMTMQSIDIEKLQEKLTPKHYFILHQGNRVGITKREFDCLQGMAQGRSNKEIARTLDISPRTIDSYQARLREKLTVHSKAALIDIYLNSELKIL